MTPRYALYYTPPPSSPLERFGASILGYDVYAGAECGRTDPETADIAAEPSRYGFHATLKAPMRLRESVTEGDLKAAVRTFARYRSAVEIGPLDVSLIGGFIALTPRVSSDEVHRFAAECVSSFDPYRAPMDEIERRRRIASGLNEQQIALLDRWGYPHVFEQFRFHMTLTNKLSPAARQPWLTRLSAAFEPLRHQPVMLDALTLLKQDDAGAKFRVIERIPLGGISDGETPGHRADRARERGGEGM